MKQVKQENLNKVPALFC